MWILLGKRCCAWSQPGVVCSEKVTFDPLTHWHFQKRTPRGQFRDPLTYTHQFWRRSVKGPRRSRGTNKQINRQTDKCCSNYSMIPPCRLLISTEYTSQWMRCLSATCAYKWYYWESQVGIIFHTSSPIQRPSILVKVQVYPFLVYNVPSRTTITMY